MSETPQNMAGGIISWQIAQYLVRWLRPGTRLGLGGGRTVAALVPVLADLYRQGLDFEALTAASSIQELLRQWAIPLLNPESIGPMDATGKEPKPVDLLVDGADEVDPQWNLIKGYGGALTREKILAHAAQQRVYLVTEEKLVPRLGSRGRLPIEILRFGWQWTKQAVEKVLGSPAELRRGTDGTPFVTENGQYILDCQIAPLDNPQALEHDLANIPGVITTGLFLGLANCILLVAGEEVRQLHRKEIREP